MKEAESPLDRAKGPGRLGRLFSHWETLLVLIFIVVNVINISLSPYYLNFNNLMNSMVNFMDKGLMVYSIMMVLILGEIDISIASIITLSACTAGWACEMGAPFWLCVCIALAVGVACGAFNGLLLVAFPELNSTIVTLGTQIFFRGLAYMLLEDNSLKTYAKQLSRLAWGKIWGMQVILVTFIVLTLVFAYVIHRIAFGRRLYAIGNNPTAAYFSGIYTKRIKLQVFAVSGLCAAFAGLFLSAKLASVRASIAQGYEMEVIAMAILGGAIPAYGKGRVVGVALGAFTIGLIRYGTGLVNVSSEILKIIIGLLLIVVCATPNLRSVIADFREARRGRRLHAKSVGGRTP